MKFPEPVPSSQMEGGPLGSADPLETHPIRTALSMFVEELRGLREMMPVLSKTAAEAELEARQRKQEVLQGERGPVFEDSRVISFHERRPLSASMRTNVLQPRVAAIGWLHAQRDIGSAVLLMMSAHFDRFVGDMMKAAFEIKPDMRRSLSREVSFRDLADLPDIEAVHRVVVEKEIEHILRDNRQAQLRWFESRCGMDEMAKELAAELSDIAELRNLIAHHGGEVTNRVGFGWQNRRTKLLRSYRAGQSITITHEDVVLVHDVLFTAAVYIAQGVWRNLREDQSLSADQDLHDLTYSRLALEEFELVQRTLLMTLPLQDGSDPVPRLVNRVNLAQTYKWLDDPVGCNKVLDSEDWEAQGSAFRFVVAVLRDEWDGAVELMEECRRAGLIQRHEFEDWPALRLFRGSEQYKKTFDRVYGD